MKSDILALCMVLCFQLLCTYIESLKSLFPILEKLYRHLITLTSIFNNTCTYFIVINFTFNTKEKKKAWGTNTYLCVENR